MELHGLISRQEMAQCPDTVLVIDGDFYGYTKFPMPKLHQHIPFKMRGETSVETSATLSSGMVTEPSPGRLLANPTTAQSS